MHQQKYLLFSHVNLIVVNNYDLYYQRYFFFCLRIHININNKTNTRINDVYIFLIIYKRDIFIYLIK